jgi:hypothetical protein
MEQKPPIFDGDMEKTFVDPAPLSMVVLILIAT